MLVTSEFVVVSITASALPCSSETKTRFGPAHRRCHRDSGSDRRERLSSESSCPPRRLDVPLLRMRTLFPIPTPPILHGRWENRRGLQPPRASLRRTPQADWRSYAKDKGVLWWCRDSDSRNEQRGRAWERQRPW